MESLKRSGECERMLVELTPGTLVGESVERTLDVYFRNIELLIYN